jgi:predicted RNase H-like HicB family nuclease
MEITVTYHFEDGTWWAESDDVPGFFAAGQSVGETRQLVRSGLAFHFDGVDVGDLEIRETRDDGNPVFVSEITRPDFSWSPSWSWTQVSHAASHETPAPGTTTHGNQTLVTA